MSDAIMSTDQHSTHDPNDSDVFQSNYGLCSMYLIAIDGESLRNLTRNDGIADQIDDCANMRLF
ncbi:hypothetical protein OUZ56_009381 [Daphnia magna]|uniref:Uncharacterized protein n=1 Tax=Daphnia magna TaxID=35525 RepID=A0ABR0AFT3_9CRUS|nr:hypothetical protein OUZ56_009381 [Daphnia magna]